jgi:hypothetical protein
MEIHERLIVDGSVSRLRTPLVHHDLKGLRAYLDRHEKYALWEAQLRLSYITRGRYGKDAITPRMFGNAQERRRRLKLLAVRVPFEPAAWFVYHYVLRLGFLEGRAGFVASRIRAQYISRVRELVERHARDAVVPV